METQLLTQFNEIINTENVIGCILSDSHGLSMLASENLKPEISGLVSALAQHSAKLHSNEDSSPIISLESDARQCLIYNEDGYTTTIFKKIHQQH